MAIIISLERSDVIYQCNRSASFKSHRLKNILFIPRHDIGGYLKISERENNIFVIRLFKLFAKNKVSILLIYESIIFNENY